jgi:hypothetical protein
VEGSRGSKVVERNAFQWIDTEEEKYPDCGHITSDIGDTPKEFEANPLVSSRNFLSNECTRDIHGEPSLGDSSIRAFLGKQVQILDAAVQHIRGVDDS